MGSSWEGLLIEEDSLSTLLKLRSELYRYYSKNIHNAYTNAVIGALDFSFDNDLLYSNLFGKAGKASIPPLYHMNDAMYYFLHTFRRILEQVHNFAPPYSGEWQKILAMQEAFSRIASTTSRHKALELVPSN